MKEHLDFSNLIFFTIRKSQKIEVLSALCNIIFVQAKPKY